MAVIFTYPKVQIPDVLDLLLITDVSDNNKTKQTTIYWLLIEPSKTRQTVLQLNDALACLHLNHSKAFREDLISGDSKCR